MIYFSNRDNKIIWSGHIQAKNPIPREIIASVHFAQADGDELEKALLIVGRQSMPFRVFTFVGDQAQTIATNWR